MAQTSMLRYIAPKPPSPDEVSRSEDKAATMQTITPQDLKLISSETQPETGRTPDANSPDEAQLLPIPGARIARVDISHIDAVKRLTSTTLPMRYPDNFFKEVIREQEVGDLARVALFEGKPIGWIRCRLEASSPPTKSTYDSLRCQIYIQALCLLAPYRQRGLACQLLQEIIRPNVQKYSATSIYAHVWENNEDALEWYERRGFTRVLLVDQYYKRLRPSGAWIVRKDLG